jgi:hypothetical protein
MRPIAHGMILGPVAVAVTIAISAAANAQDTEVQQEAAPARNGRGGIELSFWRGGGAAGSVTCLSPMLRLDIPLVDRLALSADWGFVLLAISPERGDSEVRFRIGNPFVAARYMISAGPVTLDIGGGVAIPLARIPDDDQADRLLAIVAYGVALGMRGLRDAWLWAPENLGLVTPFRVQFALANLRLGGDAALAVEIPIDSSADDVELFTQIGGQAAVVAGPVELGARLQGAWIPTEDGDNFQLSAVPFVEAALGTGYFRAAFTLNIDNPAGFSFDTGRFWSLTVGGGARF